MLITLGPSNLDISDLVKEDISLFALFSLSSAFFMLGYMLGIIIRLLGRVHELRVPRRFNERLVTILTTVKCGKNAWLRLLTGQDLQSSKRLTRDNDSCLKSPKTTALHSSTLHNPNILYLNIMNRIYLCL